MNQFCFASIQGKLGCCLALLAVALMSAPAAAQATNASLQGTYSFSFGSPDNYSIQSNMFGQQVGFCYGSNGPTQIPFGYSCYTNLGQEVITGTLVADGAGNIVSGSSYTFTADPNRYQCNPKNNPTPDCPYLVPSGISWSSSTSYVVGDEVDYGGKTYQAVKSSTNVTPSGTAVCTKSTGKNPPGCYWDQVYQSATGSGSGSGTLSGTYTVNSDGTGTMTVTPSGNNGAVIFAILVPATSAIGQEVGMVALPQLSNEFRGTGTGVRIK